MRASACGLSVRPLAQTALHWVAADPYRAHVGGQVGRASRVVDVLQSGVLASQAIDCSFGQAAAQLIERYHETVCSLSFAMTGA